MEQASLYLLCAKNYYNGTGDLATLNSVNTSLKYCMDIQLKQAVANGYKLEFCADETEICGAIDVSASGIQTLTGAQQNYWSMSSVALSSAALNFYIQYLSLRGDNPVSYYNAQSGTTLNLNTELTNLENAMDINYWRTDVLAMYSYFNGVTGFLQLVPGSDTGFDGHDLGYLLWGLVDIGDSNKTAVYNALVNGSTSNCWGSFNEDYNANGVPNSHDVRMLEIGCNISAIVKYWDLR